MGLEYFLTQEFWWMVIGKFVSWYVGGFIVWILVAPKLQVSEQDVITAITYPIQIWKLRRS